MATAYNRDIGLLGLRGDGYLVGWPGGHVKVQAGEAMKSLCLLLWIDFQIRLDYISIGINIKTLKLN